MTSVDERVTFKTKKADKLIASYSSQVDGEKREAALDPVRKDPEQWYQIAEGGKGAIQALATWYRYHFKPHGFDFATRTRGDGAILYAYYDPEEADSEIESP